MVCGINSPPEVAYFQSQQLANNYNCVIIKAFNTFNPGNTFTGLLCRIFRPSAEKSINIYIVVYKV